MWGESSKVTLLVLSLQSRHTPTVCGVLLCVELCSYLTGVMFVEGKNIDCLKFGQVFMVVSPASIQLYKLLSGKPVTGGHQYIYHSSV